MSDDTIPSDEEQREPSHVPIRFRYVIARLNRHLAERGQLLHLDRSVWRLVDLGKAAPKTAIQIEKLARDLEVIEPHETVLEG